MHHRRAAIVLASLIVALALPCVADRRMPAAACGPEANKSVRLRILSYNIHHGEGIDRKLDLERIAGVIKSVKPDIVALQEVDRKVGRTKGVDQPAELARLTGMHVVFGSNIPLLGGDYGNAVLSRFPIAGHKNHKLPNFDKSEQRGVLAAEIKVPGLARPLLFLATHLDYRRDNKERLASARFINDLVMKQGKRPALLAGDLNDTAESRVLAEFEKQWTRTNPKPLPTIPVEEPTRQIDFVLYRPADRWNVIETTVLDEAVASDHRAVLAVVEVVD